MKKVLSILIVAMILMTGCGNEEKKQIKIEENAKFDVECILIEKSVLAVGTAGRKTREGILESETGERYLIEGSNSPALKLTVVGDKLIYNTESGEVRPIE